MADVIDPTGNPADAPKLDDLGNPIVEEDKPTNIDEEMMEDMKKVWSVFSSGVGSEDRAPITELQTIMRALDINLPTEESVAEVRKMIDPEGKGYIEFPGLVAVMEEKLKETDTVEDLIAELTKLDKDADGRIPTAEFKQYMMNLGNKMTVEEVEELLKEADPKSEGFINIEEFADRLSPPKK